MSTLVASRIRAFEQLSLDDDNECDDVPSYPEIVPAVTACRLWAINRQTFQAIMMKTGMAKHSEYVSYLQRFVIFLLFLFLLI